MSDHEAIGGVAIIGMACRFPGAPSVAAFWDLLRAGREAIRRFSAEELETAGVPPTLLADPHYVRARGVLDGVEQFDAAFFGFTPREASLLDPQHRMWLECAWEALEDAGYHGAAYEGAVGVFAGCRASAYLLHNLCVDRGRAEQLAAAMDPEAYQIILGNDKDFLATRTAYLLDLRGPSVGVQTACSSSLVAVAQACQSLLTHQSDLCLAGGACVVVPSVQGYRYQEGGIYAPDGHCRAFDARSRGTVLSDGVGVVVLKRLEDAVAAGDAVYAVIQGWAINNDGAGKVSFTAPSARGQAEVVALAQAVAGVDPRSVTYVEAHGTATPLGDPIEIEGLTTAFRRATAATGFCGIGSVKTNLGHTDVAAGVAGLIKTALALQHRQIPPSLHFDAPNPAIDFENSPFFVVRTLSPWRADGAPRRAGVTSLGIGGTNCHVVLEEAPPPRPPSRQPERPRHVLALSARSETALRELARRYADHLATGPGLLADVCFTANTGRAPFEHRLAIDAGSIEDLHERLAAFAGETAGRAQAGVEAAARPVIAFLFTGEGAHHAGVGRELRATQPVFRATLDRCDALSGAGRDRSELGARDPGLGRPPASPEAALFALHVALAELWRAWGVEPDVALGLGQGELAAACVAGVIGLEDGLRLVAARGRDAFERAAGKVRLGRPRVDLVSPVTGALVGTQIATPTYWRDHVGDPARVADALRALRVRGVTLVVEIGPDSILREMARERVPDVADGWLPSLCRDEPDWEPLLRSLGTLYVRGVPVDWRGFDAPYERRRLHLPTYPFERQRHWVDPPVATTTPVETPARPLLGRRLSLPFSSEIRFEATLSPRAVPHLGDHRLFGTVVVAASSDLTLFLSAVEAAFGPRACVLEELCFLRPLVLPGDGARTIQVVLAPEDDGAYSLRLVSRADGPEPHDADAWTLHVTGRLRLPDAPPRAAVDLDALRRRCTLPMSGSAFYELAWAPGANTGSAFRWIETIWQGDNEAVARTAPPPLAEVADLYPLAPGAIEACFQTLFFGGAFETLALAEGGVAYVPFTIGRFAFFERPGDHQLWCHGQARARYAVDAPSKAGDALLFDEAGRVVAEIAGFEVRQLRRQTYLGALPTGTRPRLLDRLAHRGAPPADAVRRSSHKTPYLERAKGGDPRGQLIEYLRESVAQMVGLPAAEVRDDTAFLDLGLDSIGALVLANRIRADLGISVSMATVIAAVNLPGLAAAIAVA